MPCNTDRHSMAISASAPSTPRLRMEHAGSRHTLLDGGWWTRSSDPAAELPGLLLTSLCGHNGDRVDLLVIPPDTAADAAMVLAATPQAVFPQARQRTPPA